MTTPNPDPDRMLARLEELGRIGAHADGGRTRLALSGEDGAARDLLVDWMRDSGLRVQIDAIGNVYGIAGAGSPSDALMIGSHIDTVRNAGALDGCYGVVAALEIGAAWSAAERTLRRPLVVAAFTNEEGARFGPDLMGSRVVAGSLPLTDAFASRDPSGTTVLEALREIGYDGREDPREHVPWRYLELHIEQGPVLDAHGEHLAVVEGVYGARWLSVEVRGQANHAGTTPMDLRHDAAVAAAAMVGAVDATARTGHVSVATVGQLKLHPDVVNVVPGGAHFTVDLRDASEQTLDRAEARLRATFDELARAHGVRIAIAETSRMAPVTFDAGLVQSIQDVVHAAGHRARRLCSGATHDAQALAHVCPAAMLFVPSCSGISHHPAESTHASDLALGLAVLGSVVERWLDE